MDYLLKSSAIIFLFYMCYKLFLQRDTFFESNRWFLLLGLIIASCIPSIIIPIYIEYTPIPFSEFIANTSNESNIVIQEEQFNYMELVPWIYLSGLFFFIGKLTIELLSLKRIIKTGHYQSYGKFKHIETNTQVAPFSFFNYIVYNPNQFNETELEHVINHEKVHTKQFHSIDTLVAQLACVLLWFNPFIWLYKKALQQNLEFIADQKAQYISSCKKSYQTVLLKASVKNHQLAFTNNFYTSLIKKRIIMLHKSKSKKLNQLKILVVLPLLAIFIMSFNTKTIYVKVPEEKESKEVSSSDKEIITITFNKNNTDEYLSQTQKSLEDKGITFTFKGLKRNDKDEIIAINATFEKNGSIANYSVSSEEPIHAFYFKSDNGSISVSSIDNSQNTIVYNTSGGNSKTQTVTGGRHVIVIDEEDNSSKVNLKTLKNIDSTRIIKTNSKFTWTSDDEDSNIFIQESDEPIFIINGKKVEKSLFEDVDSDDIESVFVVKGEKALKKYGDEAKNGVILMTKKGSKGLFSESEDNTVIMKSNSFTFETDGIDPIFILNGKVITKDKMKNIDSDKIESIDILKDKSAIKVYGKKGKNGVIVINTIKDGNYDTHKLNSEKQLLINDNYVYILDGKEISKPELLKVYSKATISNLSILKGEEAKKKYGEKGLNGVVEVTSKSNKGKHQTDNKTFIFTSKDDNSPWQVKTEVTSVVFEDDNGEVSAKLVISKNSSDAFLNKQKNELKRHGIYAKFSKVRRNKAGEITGIKISLDDNKGRKSSASWKEKDQAIPDIVMGKSKDDKLFVRAIRN